MALFSRIFSRNNRGKDTTQKKAIECSTKESKSLQLYLNKNDIRVLLFRECDWRGRKLLFDSTLVEKVQVDANTSIGPHSDMIVECSSGIGYKYKKPHPDTNNLGEIIFGSIAMASGGPSVKVHSMKDPPQIMFTKVVQAPRSRTRKPQISDEKLLEGSQRNSFNSIYQSNNSGSFSSKAESFEATLDDNEGWGIQSSYGCSCSSSCPLHPPSFTRSSGSYCVNSNSSLRSGSSLSSLRHRWFRSVATFINCSDTSQQLHLPRKRTKLGIALIVPLEVSSSQEMEQFLLERMFLMNNILTRLQHSSGQAYSHREVFVQSMLQASNNAVQSILNMMTKPGLVNPLWLTLTSDHTDTTIKDELADRLVNNLSQLLKDLDTKHTNFFISTLVTAVLTQHLGWVPPTQADAAFKDLSKNHPYNPLWAQLSDLQGALGHPQRPVKTVVVGKSYRLVQQLLSVLSYFIRCGHVTTSETDPCVLADEETKLKRLFENGQEENSLFVKEAIREFSKAGSFNDSDSIMRLSKSRTVLTMKTFSLTDCETDNSNSLGSGFESSNEFSGERYGDAKQSHGLNVAKGTVCVKETSFSGESNKELSIKSLNRLSNIKMLDSNSRIVYKVFNERQLTSIQKVHTINQIDSRSKSQVNNDINVVFMLGESDELVNLKSSDASNENNPSLILLDNVNAEIPYETNFKTDFVTGNINNKVVIVHSTPIELERSSNTRILKTEENGRSFSVPEEEVWFKKKKPSEVIHLTRWLSDGMIPNANWDSVLPYLSTTTDCGQRTSIRYLEDTSIKLRGSVELFVNNTFRDLPEVKVNDIDEKLLLPIEKQTYFQLPFQRSIEKLGEKRLLKVASSLLGGVSDSFSPDLVLQGLMNPSYGWEKELHESLSVDFYTEESEPVCILANTETWEVLLVTSRYTRGVGMSQIIAEMLESTTNLFSLTHSTSLCLSHMEAKLLDLSMRSQAMGELLINSDFINIATLTSELGIEANDVPLLLSVASTHNLQVTQKYGLSFQ